jgi:DNA-binding transcriptional regulator YhcF (GntR family)
VKITISKDNAVPIRDQLVEQIGLQIASGALKGDEKLPSIRALASRLGIHYNTVSSAYNHLAGAGLLEIRQGSGVRVANKVPKQESERPNLDSVLRAFLANAAEQGFSRQEMKDCVNRVLASKPVSRILVIDRNPDFQPVLVAELKPYFSLPVQAITPDELASDLSLFSDALIVTSVYNVSAIQNLPLDPTRLVVCTIEPGRNEMSLVAKLDQGSLLLVISISQTLLNIANKVMAAIAGDKVAIRTILLDDRKELDYMLQYGSAVICDASSHEYLKKRVDKVPLQMFRLFSQATIELISDRIEKWG